MHQRARFQKADQTDRKGGRYGRKSCKSRSESSLAIDRELPLWSTVAEPALRRGHSSQQLPVPQSVHASQASSATAMIAAVMTGFFMGQFSRL